MHPLLGVLIRQWYTSVLPQGQGDSVLKHLYALPRSLTCGGPFESSKKTSARWFGGFLVGLTLDTWFLIPTVTDSASPLCGKHLSIQYGAIFQMLFFFFFHHPELRSEQARLGACVHVLLFIDSYKLTDYFCWKKYLCRCYIWLLLFIFSERKIQRPCRSIKNRLMVYV